MMSPKQGATLLRTLTLLASACLPLGLRAQAPQHLVFAGLRTASSQGQFNAIQADTSGDLYLLLDQGDGIRLLKTDPTATNILAEAHLGAHGDIGLALALDPSGNPYVAGTTTSTTLTGTQNAAFPTRADASTNSFLAKFDPGLHTLFLTFAGSGHLSATALAATSDAVFLTGSLFASTLPTTPGVFQQVPAAASTQNGFVERFSSDGTTLVYATYLTGPSGSTAPAAIAADSSDNAYVAGYTTSVAYPTNAALIPASTIPSGFLTKLASAGDTLPFSTYIPGTGITSLALDPTTHTLLLSGTISLSQFPIATVQSPLVDTPYQSLLRIPLDGQTVTSSTLLAPGTQSVVTPGPNSTAWTAGTLTSPLLPISALSTIGTAFAAHITAQSTIDQTARFGGLPTANPNNSTSPVTLTSLALNSTGDPYLAGSFTPTTSSDLLATEQYDLSLTAPQPPLLPSSISDASLSPGTCQGSLCAGSAAYLAQLATADAPTLALSTGNLADVTLRNLGSVAATNLSFLTTGYTLDTDCPSTLLAGAECAVSLTGPGPGVLTVNANNASAQTTYPGVVPAPTPIAFSPKELDFGIQTATSAPTLRTLTITNLSQTSQTFSSILDSTATTSPFAESSSDCASPNALTDKVLPPNTTCHITFAFALTSTTPDGPAQANWTIATSGHHDVLFTGFAQAAALTPSATAVDFGTRYPSSPLTPRYLYLSNNSDTSIPHTPATISGSFTLTDLCPATLLPRSVCQIQLAYASPTTPSNDTATLALEHGISVLITGQTLPQPASGPSPIPGLTVSASTLTFSTPIPVTTTSSPQTITVTNTGTAPYPLTTGGVGDFTYTTTCPATLPPQATCTVSITFTPTSPGSRGGLLTLSSTSGAAPVYVGLAGTATPILPVSGDAIPFGDLPVSESSVQWLKVSQSFPSLTATTAPPFQVILVEDTGYGHGNPAPSAFTSSATSTCFNCFLGLRFSPTTTAPQPGSLTLTSSGAPYTLIPTGTGTPLTGLIATPASVDFGPIPVHSTSPPTLIALANLTPNPIDLGSPSTSSGYALSTAPTGGPACTGTLPPSATCFASIVFAPTVTGSTPGSLTFQTASGPTTIPLLGLGTPDTGLSLSPTSLTFLDVPGPTATQQTVTLTNTGSSPLTLGTPAASTPSFNPTTTCATLVPTASCTIAVTYIPSSAQATASLQIPATTSSGPTTYTVPLTGTYTSQSAGLQILPAQADFGPASTGIISLTRTFTLNNLTAKPVAVALSIPAQFAITGGDPCLTLAPNASCTFNVTGLPVITGATTGTLFATSTPTDGSSPANTLVYLQSYGLAPPTSILAITGPLSPNTGVVDFGQLNSGQTSNKTLTLTNNSVTQPVTIRRITSQPPFLSTTTCGPTLDPAQTCNITVTYAPVNQVPTGTPPGRPSQDIGSLTLESDAASSPNLIPLNGLASPIPSDTPANTALRSSFTLTQNSLTFFSTAVGNLSQPQTVTFTNTGTTTLHLGILTSAPEFPVTSNCAQPIAPAATCTLSLTFIPQADGPRTATLEIATDSGISLDLLSLYGLASPPSLLLDPLSLDFGSALLGTSATQTVTVTNNGLTPVVFSAITITGDYLQTDTCPTANTILPSGATCAIQVTFTPTVTGPRPGLLSVSTTASTLPLTVSLTGTATATPPNQPQLQIAPTALDFGSIPVASSSTQFITLTNAGTLPITFSTLTISGDYTQTNTCPPSNATLSPAATCTIQVTFTPTLAAPRPGSLTLTTSANPSPITISLSGTGTSTSTPPNQPQLQVTPSTLQFNSIPVGSPSTQTVTVTNTGPVSITFSAITLTGDYTQTNSCPPTNATLSPAATCIIQITFTPTTTGPRPGTLTLTTSAPSLTIPLTGTGIQSHLQITPATLDFGSIPVDSSATLPLTLANTGSAALPITLTTTGDYTATPCPATLAPTQTCTPTITFTPTTSGPRPGTLLINATPIPLTGTGTSATVVTPPPTTPTFTLTIDNSQSAIATVTQGTPATYALTVTPVNNYTGPITLTCAPTAPTPNVACSILPTSLNLTASPQTATLTLTTLTNLSPAYLLPLLFLFAKKTRRRARAILCTLTLLLLTSCGGGPEPNLRFAVPGTYTFTVTAASTTGPTITQTVTAILILTAQR